jgi:predicted flap endonuclease-1-like 5' DNA nuclease
MSLLYEVVFASRCRSNHHRLAVDALRHLQSGEAERWRDLLLHYHDEYLKGAKAPDDVFKDFKNHVLHVRDGDWGGAVEACQEWYRRTVRALRDHDWKQAAWSAGVLSHYYVDPIQPFHTHQTEEEGVIHRAVEWSFSKSYKTFQTLLEHELGGYPSMAAPTGDKWLAEMVRAGAKASNPYYELIIDHYDLDKGVKDPLAGLDDELRRTIAQLIGHAAVGFARILDRAFEQAGVKPPKVGGNLQAFFLALEIPIQAVLKAIDDSGARREVQAQYEEFRRTGKVRATLGEDDKVVRALYAAEVLKAPLSSLDAKWPREIGAKAGGAIDLAAPRPRAPKPVKDIVVPPELPVGAPRAKADKTPPKFMLDGAAPVEKAPSIGPKTAKRLEAVGVRTIADLLALKPEEGQREIGARHISAQVIRDWQAQALLACTVPGLKSREAQALVACGVRDAAELSRFDPVALTDAIARWGLSEEGARAWGVAPAPTEDDIATWIARANRASAKASAAA